MRSSRLWAIVQGNTYQGRIRNNRAIILSLAPIVGVLLRRLTKPANYHSLIFHCPKAKSAQAEIQRVGGSSY